MSARPLIDSLDFAKNGKEISGELPFAGMPRLLDELENPRGVLQYRLQGGVDKQGVPYLDLAMSGVCCLQCQRCLGELEYPLMIEVRLLLRSQIELDALEDDEEAFDSILAETQLDVINLLEEEILLSLPIAPKHEAGVCQTAGGAGVDKGVDSPFAALAKLKLVK